MAHAPSITLTRPMSFRRPPSRLILLLLGALLLLGGGLAWYMGLIGTRQQALVYQSAPVERGNLIVAIGATGPITSPSMLPLTFKSAGKLIELDVAVGDKVTAGE